jgi:signal transduction histidine kinase/CheY-like chemotaxis protein
MSAMSKSTSSFESQLRISPKWIIGSLIAFAVLLFFVSEALHDPISRSRWQDLVLLVFAGSGIAWLLDIQYRWSAAWFTIVVLIATIYFGNAWLETPGFLAFIPIPVALTAALISPIAATAVAVGETMLILQLLGPPATDGGLPTIAITLTAVWATLGVAYATFSPVHQISQWLEEYFGHAQRALEEARSRKAELEQTLKNLAYANRQLALANERTSALRAIAEEARRAKTAFVANVSHEFRTPLNMILGLVDLMTEVPATYDVVLPAEMREDLEVVHRNCEHLSNMINDVLELTQIEAGHLALRRERVDLREIINRSVTTVRPLMDKKGLSLQMAIPHGLPEVYCDRTRIQQVILNLLSNAARFTEEGGITIDVIKQNQHVVAKIMDTGPGISPEDAERIFEPFWQGTSQFWHHKGGSGLGLNISKEFIELHGGRMWLESELGVGSSFAFELPISPPMEHIVRPGHQIREAWVWKEEVFKSARVESADKLVRPRIIICDETGALYPRFSRYANEIEFVDTRDLAQVMQVLQECPAHAIALNVATVDELWPLIEESRKKAPGTPVIGCSVPFQTEPAIEAGALGFLIKPVTRADLDEVLKAVKKPVRRVLVVDDDLDFLKLLQRMLQACDVTLEVVTATSGEQALEELRRAPPDLMLLDIVMPQMDGREVLASMVQEKDLEDVAVFFVSAQDPTAQPPVSEFLVASINGRFTLSRLLRYLLELSVLLPEPDKALDLVPV